MKEITVHSRKDYGRWRRAFSATQGERRDTWRREIYIRSGEKFTRSLGLQGDPVHSEWDQPWDLFGGSDAEAETPVLWPPDAKSWLTGKDSDAGKDWRQEEKGTTEDEMAGWHHGLEGHESEWTPGVGDGQGGLACCDSWGRKESDTTEQLNWTEALPTWAEDKSQKYSWSLQEVKFNPSTCCI